MTAPKQVWTGAYSNPKFSPEKKPEMLQDLVPPARAVNEASARVDEELLANQMKNLSRRNPGLANMTIPGLFLAPVQNLAFYNLAGNCPRRFLVMPITSV